MAENKDTYLPFTWRFSQSMDPPAVVPPLAFSADDLLSSVHEHVRTPNVGADSPRRWSKDEVTEVVEVTRVLRAELVYATASRYAMAAEGEGTLGASPVVATGIGRRVVPTGRSRTGQRLVPIVYYLPAEGVEEQIRQVAARTTEGNVRFVAAGVPFPLDGRRVRPLEPGASIGHKGVGAGTLGAIVKKDGEKLLLSNNHVLAASNAAAPGDPILQPAALDGGSPANDACGGYVGCVPLNFAGRNLVDVAVAKPTVRVATQQAGAVAVRGEYLGADVDLLGLTVWKIGRTTDCTIGVVEAVGITVPGVNYGTIYTPRYATFDGQMVVRGVGRDFSARGDSGSLVWTADTALPGLRRGRPKAIGLLFAGSHGGETYVNPWRAVVDATAVKLA